MHRQSITRHGSPGQPNLNDLGHAALAYTFVRNVCAHSCDNLAGMIWDCRWLAIGLALSFTALACLRTPMDEQHGVTTNTFSSGGGAGTVTSGGTTGTIGGTTGTTTGTSGGGTTSTNGGTISFPGVRPPPTSPRAVLHSSLPCGCGHGWRYWQADAGSGKPAWAVVHPPWLCR
jgi:hypothetical protein